MRLQRILAATATLCCLATLAACKDGGKPDAPAASSSTSAAAATGPLAEAQQYLRQFANCDDLSDRPDDPRVPAADFPKAGQWSVKELGVCSDKVRQGEIVIAVPTDMKQFQEGYKKYVLDRIDGGDGAYGLESRVLIGKGFVAFPTSTKTALALVRSDLRVLTCNPGAPVPKGYKREKPLVEHCNLSDFVGSEDGSGSPNLETPQDPAGEGEKPGQPKTGSLGLPRAGSMAELRKLVGSSLDCEKHFSTDPDAVAIESIDYAPVVTGGDLEWGLTGRALCGQPAGAQRARDLSWLDTVGNMKLLQTRAKAAQLADYKDDGKLKETASRLLVGENIAVETNSPSSRHGLYQLQFLYLNCVPGFSAPSGYRLEKSQVEGCVLTNYEPDHPLG
ncbi:MULTISPECIES: hypothetical protein [Streptomyces]|uniref:hypothetical protein n=1 Tax=Streptomyces TaxID=1883 RepID=UPI0004BD342A|nr:MULTISPECIES: hypothetical protein [Streptomyces]KJY18779.1 hypothetical protein VR43_23330 [Streptomyces sp. NRRL S-104]KOV18369.1 hypothetical protein ADK90_22365 [Streptomyces sp. XY413]KOV39276.1 hypothetical protein ADK97_09050 [Streptomyces sp. H021]